jgi:IS5 family transposase
VLIEVQAMSQQQTLAMAAGFEKHASVTRRAEFLRQMEIVVPWRELVDEIEPFYPKAANVNDAKALSALLHGNETAVWGDQAYQGQQAVLAEHAPRAEDRTCRRWRSKLHVWPEVREQNRIKSKIRSRVEHVFKTLKLDFGFVKVRYRGLRKNLHRLQVSFALINLLTAQKHLAVAGQ